MLDQRQIELLSEKAKNYKPSEQAFSCMRGKGCSKEKCPAWLDIKWTLQNKDTGERVSTPIVGCQFILSPILWTDAISTVYRNIDTTQKVVEGFEKATEGMDRHTNLIKRGITAVLKLLGAKSIQSVIDERDELRNRLEEKELNLIESTKEG